MSLRRNESDDIDACNQPNNCSARMKKSTGQECNDGQEQYNNGETNDQTTRVCCPAHGIENENWYEHPGRCYTELIDRADKSRFLLGRFWGRPIFRDERPVHSNA